MVVTTDALQWVPMGDQAHMFADQPLVPIKEEHPLPAAVKEVNDDIVLAKLNPHQVIDLEAFACKGTQYRMRVISLNVCGCECSAFSIYFI